MKAAALRQLLLAQVLQKVSKPARYLGTEWNAVHKPWDSVKLKMVFAFPDTYEVGMSHLGLQILYGLVNKQDDCLLERVFTPWVDMEQEMRRRGLPLFSLESCTPIKEFDVVGFTLQYEMSFTNILNMLDLSGIPLLADERRETDPLVIGGGPCAYNPEPLADFFDAFVIGEGEEVILELLEALTRCRDEKRNRREKLLRLCQIPGIYVPSFYSVNYAADGSVTGVQKEEGMAPKKIKRRAVKNLETAYFPEKPIVPFIEVVHDRIMLEVARGCTRGCRFCQAGVLYRPVRERSPALLQAQAEDLVANTGHSEISLTSLSTADYSQISGLTKSLLDRFEPDRVNVSLPSLRVDSFSVELAKELQRVRKGGLTFAPEAGTQRLRDVINKGVTEADLLETAAAAFEAGWLNLKLYFMIGLPTETKEDIEAIADLAIKTANLGSRLGKGKTGRRVHITVSTSCFVPKPWTPFQWEGFESIDSLKEKQRFLQTRLRDKRITYNWHDAELSFLEAAIARGDRRLGAVIRAAQAKGCKFDGWAEHFDYTRWLEAFDQVGERPENYAYRRYKYDDCLPWDMIDAGITKAYLQREHQRASNGIRTEDCRTGSCPGCGVCGNLGLDKVIIDGGCDAATQG